MSLSAILILALCSNALAVFGGFALWASYHARRRHPTISDEGLATELRKLRESLDAMAREVDRIGESQRLTTRILTDASSMRPTFPPPPVKAAASH